MSSSDSEGDSHGDRRTAQEPRRVSQYECPADFVSYKYISSASELLDNSNNKELWLIKAPASFNPSSFEGLKVSLSGLETIPSTDSTTPQVYSVLSSSTGPSDFHLLSSNSQNTSVTAFSGILSISESYGDCSRNQGPVAIPATPAPSIPPGLRQRFQPFGSCTPAYITDNTALSSSSASKRAQPDPGESEEQTKKKKKKKKEKHSREENFEEVHIKQEQISYDYGEIQSQPQPGTNDTVERKKKKKVKKEKERWDGQDEVTVDASLVTKEEPVDASYGDIDCSVKKKKKKKKSRDE
ncbi:CD3e molecule, epsilon associated protein [Hoplias malabaricus]|uniref:CD3e molecule, epsilon associated protein n=1 Tax=Hoplias malabaricus TaxID=27720 RepID=UPI0034636F5C